MYRRSFVKSALFGLGAGTMGRWIRPQSLLADNARGPLVVSSANGKPAAAKAVEIINQGHDALDAVIAGVNIVEDDPQDHSVGYGGLPNENGVVQLDSCCMHGPTHNAGAVAALQHIKNPSKVARLVMERSDHVLLTGTGALNFAKAHGFKEESLLTDEARQIWLYWKESLSDKDNWFTPRNKEDIPEKVRQMFNITGTITCLGLDIQGNISGVTTTSGLAFKLPGRVGDSPIIGAGLYVDNEVGACGSTGRGEENLKNLTCFLAVEEMRRGKTPQQACMIAVKRIVKHVKLPSLKKKNGRPNFNVKFYALDKKGRFGGAAIYGPARYVVHNGSENTFVDFAYLYEQE
ncbi:MAG: asparaginase [Caldithrix sp.]|nr:asparaginase [Caldithrix sp.]